MKSGREVSTAEGIRVDFTSELCLTIGGFQFYPKWKHTTILSKLNRKGKLMAVLIITDNKEPQTKNRKGRVFRSLACSGRCPGQAAGLLDFLSSRVEGGEKHKQFGDDVKQKDVSTYESPGPSDGLELSNEMPEPRSVSCGNDCHIQRIRSND